MSQALRVVHVTVRRDRIAATIELADERFAFTSPALIKKLTPRFPHLLEHACVNDAGTTFGAVAAHTPTPHLLEHMVIEYQATREAQRGGNMTYVGKTSWIDRASLRACVEVSFSDDVAALGALRACAERLDEALLECF